MDTNEIQVHVTTVPFSLDVMKEYFMNKNKFFIINYKESELKGNRFMSYVGNLEIPFEINYTDMTKEEKFDLLQEFFKSRNIVKFESMALTAAEVILRARNINGIKLSEHSIFNDAEKDEFISAYNEVVEKWITFLVSTNLFMVTTAKDINDSYNFKEGFQEIDDAHYVGQNVVQLFSVPSFMEVFFSAPIDRPIFYFKHQFEQYMFKGKNLFHYFNCAENIPYIIFNDFLNGRIKPEQLTYLKQAQL
jgi:hypothetical protein